MDIAGDAKKVVGEKVEEIGKSGAFQAATSSAAKLKSEIEGHSLGGRVYVTPNQLRKRKQTKQGFGEEDGEGNSKILMPLANHYSHAIPFYGS